MKRGGKLIALAAVLAVVLGVYFGVSAAVKKDEANKAELAAQTNTESLAVGGYDDIDFMDWTYGGVRVTLEKNADGEWSCPDEPNCPIDQSKAAIMQSAAASVAGELYVQGAESLSDYALDEPELELTVRAGDAERRYTVGSYSDLAGAYYMTMDGGTDVYLEDGGLTGAFWYDLENLVAFESAPDDIARYTSLAVVSDGESYTFERVDDPLTVSYTDAFEWFDKSSGDYTPLDTDAVEALCDKAADIEFTACETWDADDAALADYGLDTPQGTVTIGYETEDGEAGSFALEFGAYADGGEVYVHFAGSKSIYRANGTALDAFMYADQDELRPENFLALDGATVASLELEADGLGRSVDVELADVQDFLDDLAATYSTGTAPEGASREQLLSLSITFEGDVPSLTAAFYRYDSTSCICVANGASYLVSRTGAEALAEAAGALLRAR